VKANNSMRKVLHVLESFLCERSFEVLSSSIKTGSALDSFAGVYNRSQKHLFNSPRKEYVPTIGHRENYKKNEMHFNVFSFSQTLNMKLLHYTNEF
jgi:hypothetical protein